MIVNDAKTLAKELELSSEYVDIGNDKKVRVTELSGPDYFDLFQNPAFADKKGEVNMTKLLPVLVAKCIVDKEGNQIFDEKTIKVIQRSKREGYQKLLEAALRLNGLSGKKQETESPPTDGSSSD